MSREEGTAGMSDPNDTVVAVQRTPEDVLKWQRKLLPFMSRFLVSLAIGFFLLTLYNGYEMRSFIKGSGSSTLRERIEATLPPRPTGAAVVEQSLLMLEAEAMERRYQQASALLLSRIWTRQLTFMTGMVLAFMGAVFILGKLSETRSDANLGTEQVKAAISSSSPGLIMVFFGTVLIALTILVQPNIEVQDRPIYFGMVSATSGARKEADVPADVDAGPLDPGILPPSSADKTTEDKK